jgi:hypothetical protein
MKNIVFCLLLVPFVVFSQKVNKKVSVLFLGNSYTFVNNLPLLVSSIAAANGDTLLYDNNTPGGYTLKNHVNDLNSAAKIDAAPWQFVVLQAQSQEPAFSPGQVNSQTLPYAIILDSLIKKNNPCTKTMFYETWGRKNGDAQNCAFYPPICTYTGMQDRLKQSYKMFADTTKGIVVPAGEAFRKSILQNSNLELYDADQSHPSLNGSYLAAAVFYEMLFQKSVISNTFNPGLAANTHTFLQQVAHSVVNDSLLVWNIGKNLPWSDFTYTQTSASNFQFQSTFNNYDHFWNFGDGFTTVSPQPVHQFNSAGTFTVTHVVGDSCYKDVSKTVITVLATQVPENKWSTDMPTIYPNPCKEMFWIKGAEAFKNNAARIEISNLRGAVVYNEIFSEIVNTDQLKPGLYFIKLYKTDKCLRVPLLIAR